jgi:hypothetical protein
MLIAVSPASGKGLTLGYRPLIQSCPIGQVVAD